MCEKGLKITGKIVCNFSDAYRNSKIVLYGFVTDGDDKMGVFRAAEVDKSGCLNPVFHVGF